MKVMFLDESGDHSLNTIDPSYPMFVLAGCIFDFDYYTNTIEPKLRELKIKHFGKERQCNFAILWYKETEERFLCISRHS